MTINKPSKAGSGALPQQQTKIFLETTGLGTDIKQEYRLPNYDGRSETNSLCSHLVGIVKSIKEFRKCDYH